MKKSILFLSFLILIQANPLCAMQRKEHRASGHRTSVLRAVSPVLTLALLLALVKPAEGYYCAGANIGSRECVEGQQREDAEARRRQGSPNFGPFGGEAYAQAVGMNYADRNRMDAQMRHWDDQVNHFGNLGYQQGHR